MKTLFIFSTVFFSIVANAQELTKVSLQASGLTCSMCSNSINKALKTIDFVDKVDANIETASFEITFKPNSNVDFDKLKKKVEDAGFFVSKFIAIIQFTKTEVKDNEPLAVGNNTFVFTKIKDQFLSGEKPVQIIDKGFVSSKEYKKNPLPSKGGKIYHATLNLQNES